MIKLLFETVILPPGLFIVIFIACGFWAKPLALRISLLLAGMVFWLLSMPVVGDKLLAQLQYDQFVSESEIEAFEADAIVVLVSGVYPEPNEFHQATVLPNVTLRLRYSVLLAKKFNLPLIISGNSSEKLGYSAAGLAAKVAAEEFDYQNIVLEEHSNNTAMHPQMLAPIFSDRDWHKLILVTHSWHMPRALKAFSQSPLEVLPAPMGTTSTGTAGEGLSRYLPNMWAFQRSFHYLNEKLHDFYKLFV